MLTKLLIHNFKLFDEVEIELADRVILIGPNNAGKTSALQALALWDIGIRRWAEKKRGIRPAAQRPGVTVNRRDLITIPIPSAKLLWRDLRTQESGANHGARNIYIKIIVEGVNESKLWQAGLEFYYANEESFYCRPIQSADGARDLPPSLAETRMAYLPPMSGLAAAETRLEPGAINVRLGEGRSAEVLRNLCYQVWTGQDGKNRWNKVCQNMKTLFGIQLNPPEYIQERGEIEMSYLAHGGHPRLDLLAGGRGQQQTLLLLAHMTAHPGAILLLDEPDAHLEILRQRQIYQVLSDTAKQNNSQIIAASHSEIFLDEAADRDVVVAFVGRPHRIDDRGSQVRKSLKEIGFEQYYQAEIKGWALYLEGSTDLAILRAFAKILDHPAQADLDAPFVHYVLNQPGKARDHFYGLREAKPDLRGLAIFDHLEIVLQENPGLDQRMWERRELENYVCQRNTFLQFASSMGRREGVLFAGDWAQKMEESIAEVENASQTLGRNIWSPDIKASDDVLDPIFKLFYKKLNLPNLMEKSNYHELAPYVAIADLSLEITQKLDAIHTVAQAPGH